MTADGLGARDALLEGRRAEIDACLRPLLAGARGAALVGFPTHGNPGDSAIWLGQLAALARLGVAPAHAADARTYDPGRLRAAAGDGVVLVSGGGNLGDVWRDHQRLRERVLADVPRAHVVQLPQTIRFETPEGRAQARLAFRGHPRVTLLVRDVASRDRAREDLGVEARLCPDMALALPPRPARRGEGVLWLLRRDRESAQAIGRPPAGARVVDWPQEPRSAARRLQRLLTRSLVRFPGGRLVRRRLLESTYEPVARGRVEAAMALLSSARVVVTDRLHAHLLCVLAGIPHVVVADRYAKVPGVRDAWTREAPSVADAASLEEAGERAAELLARAR